MTFFNCNYGSATTFIDRAARFRLITVTVVITVGATVAATSIAIRFGIIGDTSFILMARFVRGYKKLCRLFGTGVK